MKQALRNLTLSELKDYIVALKQPAFRAKQVLDWLLAGVDDIAEMRNLPKTFLQQLDEVATVRLPVVLREQQADDGTRKVLWGFPDGATVESVLMQYKHGFSACLSTQVGCKMGCAFCASCADGFVRQLSMSDMLGQFLGLRKLSGEQISRVVLMGMGEPLDNLVEVQRFLEMLTRPDGIGMSPRHVSVSTCGLPEGIEALAALGLPVTLSVSLHAPDNLTRSQLMPINERYDVADVLAACHRYFQTTGRRISYEYIMIAGVNDSVAQAQLLGKLLKGQPAHVNLIACNPVKNRDFRPSPPAQMAAFQAELEAWHVTVTVRRRLGKGIDAACGQLRQKSLETR